MCAKEVVAGVRSCSVVIQVRRCSFRPRTSAHLFRKLEGLAPARAWGFESPLPHQPSLACARSETLLGELRLASHKTGEGRPAVAARSVAEATAPLARVKQRVPARSLIHGRPRPLPGVPKRRSLAWPPGLAFRDLPRAGRSCSTALIPIGKRRCGRRARRLANTQSWSQSAAAVTVFSRTLPEARMKRHRQSGLRLAAGDVRSC